MAITFLAGCVLANRLSSSGKWKVLLLEAGGDETFITDIPAMHNTLFGSQVDWNYTTVRQSRACLGNIAYPFAFIRLCLRSLMHVKHDPGDFSVLFLGIINAKFLTH